MTRYRLSAIALALLVWISATGCSYVKTPVLAFSDDGDYLPGKVGTGLVASPTPLIPDVPMPVGFKAVPSQSHWHFDGRVRVVNHVYQGQAKDGDAAAFYRLVLPQNDWAMIDSQAIGDTVILRYTKGPESLSVTCDPGWSVTTVTISIGAR